MQLLSTGNLKNLLRAASGLEHNLLCAVLKECKMQNLLCAILLFMHNLLCAAPGCMLSAKKFTLQIQGLLSVVPSCLQNLPGFTPGCESLYSPQVRREPTVFSFWIPERKKEKTELCIHPAELCRTY